MLKHDLRSRRGAVLILGGIMLNVWAAALLFQPVEEHMVKKYKEVEEEEDVPQVGLGFVQISVEFFVFTIEVRLLAACLLYCIHRYSIITGYFINKTKRLLYIV